MRLTSIVAIAILLVTGACSKDSSEAQAAASPPAASAKAYAPVDLCALVTQEEAESILGKKLETPKRQTNGDCWYLREGTTDFGGVEFILSILPVPVRSEKEFDELVATETARMNTNLQKAGVGAAANFAAEKAQGVGAPAYFIDPGLYVLKGSRILAVALGGDQGVAVAKLAVQRLP